MVFTAGKLDRWQSWLVESFLLISWTFGTEILIKAMYTVRWTLGVELIEDEAMKNQVDKGGC